MATMAPSYTVSLQEEQCELHFTIAGFFGRDGMAGFLDALNEATKPLVKAGKPIYSLGDFTDFVPQDRATGELIRNHLINARKHGLKRIAIVGSSPLMTMQYRRLSEGIDVEFFDSKATANTWLRDGR